MTAAGIAVLEFLDKVEETYEEAIDTTQATDDRQQASLTTLAPAHAEAFPFPNLPAFICPHNLTTGT